MEPHIKIINDTAKRILRPAGLFRVGSSRTWIEDNGYYFTVVDFEPGGFTEGSYLNVGTDFLWGTRQETQADLRCEIGGRVIVGRGNQFAEYRPALKDCDAVFAREIGEFADAALQRVTEYRKFRDLEYAKQTLRSAAEHTPPDEQLWELYRLAMLCLYKGDCEEGGAYLRDWLALARRRVDTTVTVVQGGKETIRTVHCGWLEEFCNACEKTLLPLTADADTAQGAVTDRIRRRRAVFAEKKAFRGMGGF